MELTKFGFDASYNVERLYGRPLGSVHEFRRPRHEARSGELVLETGLEFMWFKLIPEDREPWVGGFECGPGGMTGLFATPSPEVVCLVAKGQGYWVPVLVPEGCEVIRSIPIKEVFAIAGHRKLIFADFTQLAAYGSSGFLWRTDRLSWDGLKVAEVTENGIRGMAWDSPVDREVPFYVDIETRASEGGSNPEKYGAGQRKGP